MTQYKEGEAFKKCKKCKVYFPADVLTRHMKRMHKEILLQRQDAKLVYIPVSNTTKKKLDALQTSQYHSYTEIIKQLLKEKT